MKSKCAKCGKKINPIFQMTNISMKCKCGKVFCRKHLVSHKCTHNFHEEYKKNVKIDVKNKKIEII